MKYRHQLLLILILSINILACSSDNDEPVNSLILPTKVNVASGNSTQAASANNAMLSAANAVLTDPDTDYSTDVANVYNYTVDAAGRETVRANYMLCILEKFKYAEKLNAGPYNITFSLYDCVARAYPELIGLFEELDFIAEGTITSTRANNNSPQRISAWLSFNFDKKKTDNPKEIEALSLVEVTILNNVSDVYPFGNFILNATGIGDAGNYGGNVGEEYIDGYYTFNSTLDGAENPTVKIAYVTEPNSVDVVDFMSTTVNWSRANFDNGSMRTLQTTNVYSGSPVNFSTSTLLGFDKNNVLRSRYADPTEIIKNQICLSRSEFSDQHWFYNLYHAADGQFRGDTVGAGDRVNLTSRIEFIYNGARGSVTNDYFWMENGDELPDGASVTENNSNEIYTAHVVNGELTETKRIKLLLSTLKNRQFKYFGKHPAYKNVNSWILEVSPSNNFRIIKIFKYIAGEKIISDTFDHDNDTSTAEVSVTADLEFTNGMSISISDNIYNSYQYTHDELLTAEARIIHYKESRGINAANTDLFTDTVKSIKLYCYKSCPKGGLTQTDVDLAESRSELHYSYLSFNNTPSIYTLKLSGFKLELFDDTNTMLVDISGLDYSKKGFSAFLYSSEMSTVALPAGATENQLNQLDVSFSWGMSNENSYYKTVTLSDSANKLVVFDEPIKIEMLFDAANDINNSDPATNPFHGQTYRLSYSGDNLFGLPNTTSSVGSYYVRDINLKDGTPLTSENGNFVTRATYIARNLLEKSADVCSALSLEGLIDKPLTLLTEADLSHVSFTVADRPVVSSPSVFSE